MKVASIVSAKCGSAMSPIGRPLQRHVDALRGEQQRGLVTLVHRWNRCEKPLHVARIEVARRLAILFEAVPPCRSGILGVHIAEKPDVEQLRFRRLQDRVGVVAPPFQIQTCDINANAKDGVGAKPDAVQSHLRAVRNRASGMDTPSKSAACATDKEAKATAARINARIMVSFATLPKDTLTSPIFSLSTADRVLGTRVYHECHSIGLRRSAPSQVRLAPRIAACVKNITYGTRNRRALQSVETAAVGTVEWSSLSTQVSHPSRFRDAKPGITWVSEGNEAS